MSAAARNTAYVIELLMTNQASRTFTVKAFTRLSCAADHFQLLLTAPGGCGPSTEDS